MAKVVIFDKDGLNARIYHMDDAKAHKGKSDRVIDPELPRGIPPHLWKLQDGKVVDLSLIAVKAPKKRLSKKHKGLILAASLALLSLIVKAVLHV